MSTTPATPPAAPAATPAPAAPVAPTKPAAPATPAIPAAQKASVRQAPAVATTTDSRMPPEAPPTLDNEMRKLAEEHFKPKAAEAAPPVTAPAKPAETPPVAATTEADPFAHIKEPEFKTEASREGWKALKKEASEKVSAAEKKYNEAITQLDTYKKATPADTAEAARLKTELKEAHDKLAVFDLKSSPDFVREFVQPKKNALKDAAEVISYNGKEGVDLSKILDLPLKDFNAQVSEITKDMNGMDAQTVQASLRQAHKLAAAEKAALVNSSELKAQIEAKHAAAERAAFDETRSEVSTKVPEMKIPDGASEETITEIKSFNKARAEALVEAETYSFGKSTASQVAKIAHQAAMLKPVATILIPALQRDLKRSNSMVAELTAELQAIKAGKNPGKFTAPAATPNATPAADMSFKELAAHMLEKRLPV